MTNKVLSLTLSLLVTGVVVPRVEAQSAASAAASAGSTAAATSNNQQKEKQKQFQTQRQQQTQFTNSTVSNSIGGSPATLSTSTGVNTGSLWWLNPATLPEALSSPNKFDFEVPGVRISCGLPAEAHGLSIYIAAWNSAHSSDKVSAYCRGLIEWAKDWGNVEVINQIIGNLPPEQRPEYSKKVLNSLGNKMGIDFSGVEAPRIQTQTIYVPFNPSNGTKVPPVKARD